jgi:hypothetical protein
MKNVLTLVFALLLLSFSQASFAAFPVKKATAATSVTTTNPENNNPTVATHQSKAARFIYKAAHTLHLDRFMPPEHGRRDGTLGILSLIFGILGAVTFVWGGGFYFGIPALVLGAIGQKHKERFSLAGLILGIVEVALTLLIFILAIVIVASFL